MKAHGFLSGVCKHGYNNYCPLCEEERRSGLTDWRYCSQCGYGIQKFIEKGNGAEIYECLNCHLKIPTLIEITIGKAQQPPESHGK